MSNELMEDAMPATQEQPQIRIDSQSKRRATAEERQDLDLYSTDYVQSLYQDYTIFAEDSNGNRGFTTHAPGATKDSLRIVAHQMSESIQNPLIRNTLQRFIGSAQQQNTSVDQAFPQSNFQFLRDSVEADLKAQQNKYGLVDLNPDVREESLLPMVFDTKNVNLLEVAGPQTFANMRGRSAELAGIFNSSALHDIFAEFQREVSSHRKYRSNSGKIVIEAMKRAEFDSIRSSEDLKHLKLSTGESLEEHLERYAERTFGGTKKFENQLRQLTQQEAKLDQQEQRYAQKGQVIPPKVQRSIQSQRETLQKRKATTQNQLQAFNDRCQKYAQNEIEYLYTNFQRIREAVRDREEFLAFGASDEEKRRNPAMFSKSYAQHAERDINIHPVFLLVAALQGDVHLYDYKDVSRFIRDLQTTDGPNGKHKAYRTATANEKIPTRALITAVYGEDVAQKIETHQYANVSMSRNIPANSVAGLLTRGESALAYKLTNAETGEKGAEPENIARIPGNKAKDVQLTKMTFGEVMKMQSQKKIFAAGRYQIIEGTLKETFNSLKRLGLVDENTLFDKKAQDLCFMHLAKRRKIDLIFKDNVSSSEINRVINGFAAEWRAFYKADNTPWDPNDKKNKPTIRAEETRVAFEQARQLERELRRTRPDLTKDERQLLALTGQGGASRKQKTM